MAELLGTRRRRGTAPWIEEGVGDGGRARDGCGHGDGGGARDAGRRTASAATWRRLFDLAAVACTGKGVVR